MNFEDKINILTNEFAVTEKELKEVHRHLDGIPIKEESILSFAAVMIDQLRISEKETVNFLNHLFVRVDFKYPFVDTLYRLFYQWKRHESKEQQINFLKETIGTYMLHKLIVLLQNIDTIEKYQYRISE